MANMKRLHEALQEAERLTANPPGDAGGWLLSLFRTSHEIARHGNEGVQALAEHLFRPKP